MTRLNSRSGRRSRPAGAFSLLELLLVLIILGLLASATAVSLLRTGERANIRVARTGMDTLKGALTEYKFSNGAFPTTEEGLNTLVPDYVERRTIEDPWQTPYLYISPTGDPNRPFDLRSAGPDKEHGTPDDISVWDEAG